MKISFFILLILLSIFTLNSCEKKQEIVIDSSSESINLSDEAPCDDPEAAKIKIVEEEINLLEEDEGCKLPQ